MNGQIPFLKSRLQHVAFRRRRLQLLSTLAACWAGAAILGWGLMVLERRSGWTSSLALPLIALLGLTAAFIVVLRHRRKEPNWHELAAQIESRHPDLDGRLLT